MCPGRKDPNASTTTSVSLPPPRSQLKIFPHCQIPKSADLQDRPLPAIGQRMEVGLPQRRCQLYGLHQQNGGHPVHPHVLLLQQRTLNPQSGSLIHERTRTRLRPRPALPRWPQPPGQSNILDVKIKIATNRNYFKNRRVLSLSQSKILLRQNATLPSNSRSSISGGDKLLLLPNSKKDPER